MSLYKNYTLIAKSKSVNFSDDVELERASAGGYVGDVLKGAVTGAAAGTGAFLGGELLQAGKAAVKARKAAPPISTEEWNTLTSYLNGSGEIKNAEDIFKKLNNPKDRIKFFQEYQGVLENDSSSEIVQRYRELLNKNKEKGADVIAEGFSRSLTKSARTEELIKQSIDVIKDATKQEALGVNSNLYERLGGHLSKSDPNALHEMTRKASGSSIKEDFKNLAKNILNNDRNLQKAGSGDLAYAIVQQMPDEAREIIPGLSRGSQNADELASEIKGRINNQIAGSIQTPPTPVRRKYDPRNITDYVIDKAADNARRAFPQAEQVASISVDDKIIHQLTEAHKRYQKRSPFFLKRWIKAGLIDNPVKAAATKSIDPLLVGKARTAIRNKPGKAALFIGGGALVTAAAAAITKSYVSSVEHNIDTMIRKDQRIGYKLSGGWFGLSESPIKKYLTDNARLDEIQNSYINALKAWYKDPKKFEIKGMNITGVTIEKPELQYVAMSVKPQDTKATAELKLYYKTEAKIKGNSTVKSEGNKPKSIDATSYDQVTVYLTTVSDAESKTIARIKDFGETGGLQKLSPAIKWDLTSKLTDKNGHPKQIAQDLSNPAIFQERHMKPIFNLKAALQNVSSSENNLPEKLIGYNGKTIIKQPLNSFGFNPELLDKTNLVIQPFGINLGV